jgi:hypothetical protein
MSSLLSDMAAKLAAAGCGTVGATIFVSHRPATPDACLTLYQYAGEPPELVNGGAHYEHPGLQVWSRAKTADAAMAALDAVVTALHGLTEYTGSYARYLTIAARQSPAAMGLDDNGRFEYVCNFRVTLTRA